MKTLASVIFGASLLVSTATAQDLLIGSTSASSSHYGYFVAVGQLINENVDGMTASIVETGATMDNIRRIDRGQIDLGLVATNTANHAVNGKNAFENNPQDLQLLWVYTNAPQNVIVREDSGVDSLTELAGVRFNPGIKGSATEATTESVFDTLGLTADFVRGSTTDIVNAIKDNRIAGYVKSGSGQKFDGSTMDIATATDIKVIGLTDDQVQTLRNEMQDISIVEIPANSAADGIPAYRTWNFSVGVAAPSTFDEQSAYDIVNAIMSDKSIQSNAMASLKGVDIAELTLNYATIKLHPGAVRWFVENGHSVPAKLQP